MTEQTDEQKAPEEAKLRTLRKKVEEDSEALEKIVDSIVSRFAKDLDDFVGMMKDWVESKRAIPDSELESAVLKIPIYFYWASSGLESLGIEGDTAKAIKIEVFNRAFMSVGGTIQDKTKYAEMKTFPEYYIEVAYQRAYKKLKAKIEAAEAIFSGAKKVLSKRMLEIEIAGRDQGGIPPSRRRDRDRDD